MKPNMRLTVKLKIVTKYKMIALMRSFVTKVKRKWLVQSHSMNSDLYQKRDVAM